MKPSREKEVDIHAPPPGQSGKSIALSRKKKKADMKDGDTHWTNHDNTIGPINDMYLAIREYAAFPFGAGHVALIQKTH